MVDTSAGIVTIENAAVAGPQGLSLWHLFIQADFFVQFIMVGLVAVSIWCWTIILSKYKEFKKFNLHHKKTRYLLDQGQPMDELFDAMQSQSSNSFKTLFLGAMEAWEQSVKNKQSKQRAMELINQRIYVLMKNEIENLEKHTNFLATVGSSATFIGLLGTVWGIMHSFQSIAGSQNTSLAVVAPGIAEALAATALGLIAAIPAMIAYNKITYVLGRYEESLEDFCDTLYGMIDRNMDE